MANPNIIQQLHSAEAPPAINFNKIMNERMNEQERLVAMADDLMRLQENTNEGRGHRTVQQITRFLRQGDSESARAICLNDGDKIALYPQIVDYLVKNLYAGENHPWPASYEADKTEY